MDDVKLMLKSKAKAFKSFLKWIFYGPYGLRFGWLALGCTIIVFATIFSLIFFGTKLFYHYVFNDDIEYHITCHTPINMPTTVNMSCNALDASSINSQTIIEEFDKIYVADYAYKITHGICFQNENESETCILNTSCTVVEILNK